MKTKLILTGLALLLMSGASFANYGDGETPGFDLGYQTQQQFTKGEQQRVANEVGKRLHAAQLVCDSMKQYPGRINYPNSARAYTAVGRNVYVGPEQADRYQRLLARCIVKNANFDPGTQVTRSSGGYIRVSLPATGVYGALALVTCHITDKVGDPSCE
ncbi:MAG: hypothetical protein JSS53_03565 [Proteobacteria bacterium]|nr:hypothetical protein [Pseudomonadota bacterium]